MILSFVFNLLFVVRPCAAAPPPAQTYVLAQSVRPSNAYAELFAFDPVAVRFTQLLSATLSNSISDFAVVNGAAGLALLTVTSKGQAHLMFASQGFQILTSHVSRAACEYGPRGALVSTEDNEIHELEVGQPGQSWVRQVLGPGQISKLHHGVIQRLRSVGNAHFAALTHTHLIVGEHVPGGIGRTVHQILHDFKLQGENVPGYPSKNVVGLLDFAPGPDSAWILAEMTGGADTILLRWDYASRAFTTALTLPVGPDVSLLGVELGSGALLVRHGGDYGSVNRAGLAQYEQQDFFSLASLHRMGLPQTVTGDVIVRHPSAVVRNHGVLTLISGPGPGVVAGAAPPASRQIKEPVTESDYQELMRKELGAAPDGETAERFAERMNATNALKYEMKMLEPGELARFGLKRQMDWLVPLKGKEAQPLSRADFARALAAGRAREITQQKCATTLTK